MDDPCTAGRQPTSPIPRLRPCSTDPTTPLAAPTTRRYRPDDQLLTFLETL
jgi:hypothetical protein